MFSLDGSGNITGTGTNVPEPAGASFPFGITMNLGGTRLYLANLSTNNVTVFSLDGNGDIADTGTNVPEPTVASGPTGIVVR